MGKINWAYIIKLNEVNRYCERSDLVQLSMACKLIRISLSKVILNSFNFTSFTKCNGYKGYVIENYRDGMENDVFRIVNPYMPMVGDLLESKKRFRSDLNLYKCRVDKLILYFICDHLYLVYEIPSAFRSIRSLIIGKGYVVLDTIQYLMDNLTYLEDLDLSYSIFYKRLNQPSNINFPVTLKKLKIDHVAIGYIEEREGDAILCSNIIMDDEYTELEFSPINLPSLLYMHYGTFISEDISYDLLHFLALNTNIKYLCLNRFNFSPELFNLVKTFNNLIKFEYGLNDIDTINTSLVSAPVGSYIKNLSIFLPKDSDFLNMLTEQLPNLTDLFITNNLLNLSQIWPVIPKFKMLKNLTLQGNIYKKFPKELNSQKFFNLEIIELLAGTDIDFEVLNIDISSFPKLKLIKFTLDYCYPSGYDISKVPVEIKGNWELVYFPRKLSFYRVMQQNSNYNA
jgi:hypothetical protein